MDELRSLLDLPFETLAVLAAGYLAYRLAYVGRDKTHRTVDAIFISAFYAALAKAIVLLGTDWPFLVPETVGLAAAMITGACWRRWGSTWASKGLRKLGISYSDHYQSALETVMLRPTFASTTLVVKTNDGSAFMSVPTSAFKHLRDGPFILGSDGSVAMFATHRMLPQEQDWSEREVRSDQYGYELTYIPASRIAEIRFTVPD